MKQPLAFRMRPESLDEVIGQQHLIGPGQVLRRCVEEGRLFSMIFYGPPGTGKTTLASVLAREMNLPCRFFNAVTGNKKDLDTIFEESRFYEGLVLVIDEVHRLNKDKQDLLLPHVENGHLILIGATTANPALAINPAIRSRCHLFEIKALETADIITALNRAAASEKGLQGQVTLDPDAAELIARYSGGDIRYALNVLELCAIASDEPVLKKELVVRYAQRPVSGVDKNEDGHYDAVSAFQKSIRGSDVNASLYYLARLIEAGDMDSIERRLLVIAYEDIGLGNPAALAHTLDAIDAAKRVGFPEGMIPLSVAVIDLALSPKSRSACEAIHSAMEEVAAGSVPVPRYLRYTPTGLSEQDRYPYDRPDLWHRIQYLPDALKTKVFYQPQTSSAYEKQLAANDQALKQIRRSSDLASLKQAKKPRQQ